MVESIWDFYNSSSNPVRQACVAEWQGWLDDIPDGSIRQRLENDLRSLDQTRHFSAHLELYFHHHFVSQGFRVEFHPNLEDSTDHPDFLVHHECGSFYLEVTTRADEHQILEQKEFADQLKAELACIYSPHQVSVDISEPCPKVAFLPEIKSFLEQQLLSFEAGDEVEKDIVWRKSVDQKSYVLFFSLHRGSGLCQPLRAFPITCGGMSGISNLLYYKVDEKACKYGNTDLPLVIAVWGLSYPDKYAYEIALYGHEGVRWYQDRDGNVIKNSIRSGRQPDGIFTLIEDEKLKNQKVSAVVLYEHRLEATDHEHLLYVYHNPNALHPLPQKIFDGAPQFVPVEVDGHIEMGWIN